MRKINTFDSFSNFIYSLWPQDELIKSLASCYTYFWPKCQKCAIIVYKNYFVPKMRKINTLHFIS